MALTTDVFGAATDTLSTSLQWVLIYMMYFPEVQEKVSLLYQILRRLQNFAAKIPLVNLSPENQ